MNPHTRAELPYDPRTRDVVCKRRGPHTLFNIEQKVQRHSPTGMEWGYGGSGPADFAINVLLLHTDQATATDPAFYQAFKWSFIAELPKEGGVILGSAVREWCEQRIAQLGFGTLLPMDEAAA